MTTEHTDVTIPAGELINRHAAITAICRIDAARGSLETCVYVANALNEAQTALQLLPAVLLPSLSGNGEAEPVAVKPMTGEEQFSDWWSKDGQYIDPDISDVPWFDKRRELAQAAFLAALTPDAKERVAEPEEGEGKLWKSLAVTLEVYDLQPVQVQRVLAKVQNLVSFVRSSLNAKESGNAELIEPLKDALRRAEYQPGDHPVVPVKIAAFMDEVRNIYALSRSPAPEGMGTDKRIADAERERDAALRLLKMSHKATALQTMEHRALKAEAQLSALNAKSGNAELIEAALAAHPYTSYSYVAQNADVEKERAVKYARYIASRALSRSPAPEGMGTDKRIAELEPYRDELLKIAEDLGEPGADDIVAWRLSTLNKEEGE